MGMYSYLINKENKTYYELGKGSWLDDFGQDGIDLLQDQELLEEFLFDNWLAGVDEPEIWKRECANSLAKELHTFAKCNDPNNLSIINDSGDDLILIKSLKYKCIGSRYKDNT